VLLYLWFWLSWVWKALYHGRTSSLWGLRQHTLAAHSLCTKYRMLHFRSRTNFLQLHIWTSLSVFLSKWVFPSQNKLQFPRSSSLVNREQRDYWKIPTSNAQTRTRSGENTNKHERLAKAEESPMCCTVFLFLISL